MKTAAITPEAAEKNRDPVIDVEMELTVAKINCQLARHYSGMGTDIPEEMIALDPFTDAILKRFRDAGWIVALVSLNSVIDGGRHYFYNFKKP
jgi:hypothetical protein